MWLGLQCWCALLCPTALQHPQGLLALLYKHHTVRHDPAHCFAGHSRPTTSDMLVLVKKQLVHGTERIAEVVN